MKQMKVLVACEESQAVCKEFRRLGHEAYSCDIVECSGGHPEWHIMQDVLPLVNGRCQFKTMDGATHCIEECLLLIGQETEARHSPASQKQWLNSGADF